jgi:hypothetical protein
MFNNAGVLYSTAHSSQGAEKTLIERILMEPFFRKDTTVHRKIALYPHANIKDKNLIISDVVSALFEDGGMVETFRAFDYFLAISGKRGHFIHQFEVFLLGMNIVLKLKDLGHDLKEIFGFDDIDKIIYCWLIVATAHDLGYPLESLDDILKTISELYGKIGFPQLKDKFVNLEIGNLIKDNPEFESIFIDSGTGTASRDGIEIGKLIHDEILQSLALDPADEHVVRELQARLLKKPSHAYASSVLLAKAIIVNLLSSKSVAEVRQLWKFAAVKKAAAAIALHGLKVDEKPEKDYSYFIKRISFDRNPFAYLLFIIDNIQDWGRLLYVNKEKIWPEYILDNFIFTTDNNMLLDYHVVHDTWEEGIYEDVEKYLEEKEGMLNMAIKPSTKLRVDIQLEFTTNLGKKFKPIKLPL